MNKVIHGLVAAVFVIICLFLRWMLILVSGLQPGMQLPAFTRFCVSLSPLFLALPMSVLGHGFGI